MSILSTSNTNLIRQELYSRVLTQDFQNYIHDQNLFWDVTEFTDGDTINLPTMDYVEWSDYTEGTDVTFQPLGDGRKTLAINRYKQDAFAITDKFKQDSYLADLMFSKRVANSSYKIRENMQTDLFAAANGSQAVDDANAIGAYSRRLALDIGTANTDRFADFLETLGYIKEAWDTDNVPEENRLLFVPPRLERVITANTGIVADQNHDFRGIINTGLASRNQYIRNINGISILTSNLLPTAADTAALLDVNGAGVDADAEVMVALVAGLDSDSTMMGSVRQQPKSEFFRNAKGKQDEWSATARWGLGVYRPEALFCVPLKK